jgi:hypothetical protein
MSEMKNNLSYVGGVGSSERERRYVEEEKGVLESEIHE